MSTTQKGRSLDQQTRDGTSSIATLGAGGTGQRKLSQPQPGNQQSAGRTDDLLSGSVGEAEREHGFQSGTSTQQGSPAPAPRPRTIRSER